MICVSCWSDRIGDGLGKFCTLLVSLACEVHLPMSWPVRETQPKHVIWLRHLPTFHEKWTASWTLLPAS